MKLAHLILAHAYPSQLLRLVKKLQHPGADIYIYLDAKTNMADFEDIGKTENVYFLKNRIKIYWGNYSIVKGTLLALEEILQKGIAYSHINFLSGQDYPLKTAAEAQQFFAANTNKTFMLSLSVQNEWQHGLARTKEYHLGDYRLPGKYRFQKIINFFNFKRNVPGALPLYGGSQWFTITPQAAAYVVAYLKNNKALAKYFRNTFAADELVFQTILKASPFKNELVNNNLRYIQMSPVTFRPVVLNASMAQMLLNSGNFYTRKVEPGISTGLMDNLDEALAKAS